MTRPYCLLATTSPKEPPLIQCTDPQNFDLILFNYSGTDDDQVKKNWKDHGFDVTAIINHQTECKGQVFQHLSSYALDYDFIAVWDADLATTTRTVNQLFLLGQNHDWDWYQPSLSDESYHSWYWTLASTYPEYWKHLDDCIITYTPFVEVMAPIFSRRLWMHLQPLFANYKYVSGYGLDDHWIPAALTALDRPTCPVVVKSVSIAHTKPVSSSQKPFSNGLTAEQEHQACRDSTQAMMQRLYPQEPVVEVHCISLEDPCCQDRKEQFKQSADSHGLEFSFFRAVDARAWTADDYPQWVQHRGRRVDWHEPLKPGEVGVAASHQQLYEQAWSQGVTALVVFEDDAALVQALDTVTVPKDCDLLMLSNRWKHNRNGEVIGASCGTEGYVITRSGMRKMLQILKHMNMPLDLIMIAHCRSMIEDQHGLCQVRNELNPLLNIYHHHVYCIENDKGYSTIKNPG